jgi:hypothetical protein
LVTLDGEQLGRDNRWHGQPATKTIARAGGGYELTVPAYSAALVTANLRPGALR